MKLVSSIEDVKSIEKVDEKCFKSSEKLLTMHLVSWDELLKPENGFINDNSIVIEVVMQADKPQGGNAPLEVVHNQHKLECSICLGSLGHQAVSSTPCGHLYCSACIEISVETREVCPSCKAVVTLDELHRVFLPL